MENKAKDILQKLFAPLGFNGAKEGNRLFEIFLVLVLGILIGMVVKTEAAKRVTMGFNDYLVTSNERHFDYSKLEKSVAEKQKQQGAAAATAGSSCGI